ncbi:MAG TPA: MaoC family dehydratase [Deinococcales bacterium]|nr:MaoC family dehydratase [Deinococcales bacterium]
MTRELYLEDLEAGQTYRSGSLTLTPESIKAFARDFDPQPFHTDEAAAAGSFFGGLAASGWHTAALTMRLLVTGEFRIAGGLIGAGVEDLRWPRPVRPGESLSIESEVLAVRSLRSRPTHGLVKLRTVTRNAAGETVQEFTASLVVPRREAPAGS